ncbi:MAG TPA: DMT family transporter [Patescibacteria group bacterium]|nr:DMT family transporter [Patescibacteria group bacterium]
MWILWALLSALFAATRRTQEKQLTHHLNHFTIAFAVQLLSLPVIFLALILDGGFLNPLRLGLTFWLPLVIVCIGFYPLNAFLYLQAIKHSELSKVLPIQSLWPVFSLIPAWLTLGEIPTIISTAGILLTVLGVYVLGMKKNALHHPLQPFREEKSSRYMIFAVMLVTLAGILDKIAINASNAVYYSFVSTVGAVLVLFTTLYIYKINELSMLKNNLKNLGLIGTLQGSSYTT